MNSRTYLRDHLSHLSYSQAVKLLGTANGKQLLQRGGEYEIDPDQVELSRDRFRLNWSPEMTVTLTLDESAKAILSHCSGCRQPCKHLGAALAFILEEKQLLGLSAPPPERTPVEMLSEAELIEQALEERRERARNENMRLKSSNTEALWGDYVVINRTSGKSYRVALRGWQRGDSFCTCPDFRKNTLGTCKHILHALEKIKRRFPAAERNRPFQQLDLALHLLYGEHVALRMLIPDNLSTAAKGIVSPMRNRDIDDVHDLLRRIRKLEAQGRTVLIYPDAEEYIAQRLFSDHIENTVREIRAKPAKHPMRQALLKTELLPYQLDGIAFAAGAGRAILADDMGLGKTIQGIGVAELLAREAGIEKVLVVAPASLKFQWRNEIERFSERSCMLIVGSAAERARLYADNLAFFSICNYEQVLRDAPTIKAIDWDLIILDEGQRIKNWESKTSQTIKTLKSRFALVLSGTPLENRLDDLHSIVEFIDDRRLGPRFRFHNRHRVVDEKGKILGYRNLAELRGKLKGVLLRRTRAQVMRELPPRTTEVVRIAPTEEQLEMHSGFSRTIRLIAQKPYITEMDLLRLQKALLMCRLCANNTSLVDKQLPGYSSKLVELDALLAQLAQEDDRKILLFSEWTGMLDLIEPILTKRKLGFVRLDGSVPQKKRQQLVQRFRDDDDCRVFITTNAGSTGLNLQVANTVINVDLPWNPAVLEQRISRAHRMGQSSPVQVYILITQETLEESLLGTLSAKNELSLAALDLSSELDTLDMVSGLDELKRRLEVLLGTRPDAPIDESGRQSASQAAEAQRHRVARAGGQLVNAAFEFLHELIPESQPSEAAQGLSKALRDQLADCLSSEENGQLTMTVTLPDRAALDRLADSLAGLLATRSSN